MKTYGAFLPATGSLVLRGGGCREGLSSDDKKGKISRSSLLRVFLAPRAGLEPATYWLTANRSTTELCRNTVLPLYRIMTLL